MTDTPKPQAVASDIAAILRVAEATTQAQQGVTDAAAVVRRRGVRGAQTETVDRTPVDPTPIDTVPDGPATTDRRKPLAEVFGGEFVVDSDAPDTLLEALRIAAAGSHGTVYLADDSTADRQSYAELVADAERVLLGLRAAGLLPGDSVIVQFEDSRHFVTAVWACVLGGFVPTPTGTAPRYDQDNAENRRLRNAWLLLDRPVLLTDASMADRVRGLADLWDDDQLRVLTLEQLGDGTRDTAWHAASPDDTVIQLLTSGSTGVPKCVRHNHRSILARTRSTAVTTRLSDEDVTLNWMPLDHVGGLVMSNIRDVIVGCEHVNATTHSFLADPLRWLDWMDRFQVTNTWAPNFAFALVNEQLDGIDDRSWDLSRLTCIVNAGEAVVARTAHRFLELLRPHGLPSDAMWPCWGMSETCSGVTYSRLSAVDASTGVLVVDQRSLSGDLAFVDEPAQGDPTLTEVGGPIAGVALRIVDQGDTVLPEERIGRLQIRGATMMQGYHRNPEANQASYTDDGWYDTGDLAFLREGSLTIAGRAKDVIIINGKNFLSHELESVIEQVPGVEPTFAAACAEQGSDDEREQFLVFYSPDDGAPGRTELASRIRVTLARDMGIRPDVVVAVDRPEFPKTPSGKIQRATLLDRYRAGTYGTHYAAEDHDIDTRCFAPSWSPITAPATEDAPPGTWLWFVDPRERGTVDIARTELGVRIVAVLPGMRYERLAKDLFVVNPADGNDYTRLLAAVDAPVVVVHDWCGTRWADAKNTDALDTGLDLSTRSVRLLWQVLDRAAADCRVLVATTAGVWARPGDCVDYAKGVLPGLIRTAAAEQPGRWLRMVDVDESDPATRIRAIADELSSADTEPVTALRSAVRLVPRLLPVAEAGQAQSILAPGGRYVLTGGLGGIGFEIAEYLLATYAAELLIVGRSTVDALDDEKSDRLASLTELGAVHYASVDVADPDALDAVVGAAEQRWGGPVDAVLHLAGADMGALWSDWSAHMVVNESEDSYAAMYQAKVFGTWAVSELLAGRPDADLVLFSSVNGYFGGSGFGAYASANSFVDGFAHHWAEQRGRRVHCLCWTPWADTGMSRPLPPAMTIAAEHRGFARVTPDDGLALFVTALSRPEPVLLIGLNAGSDTVVSALDHAALGRLTLAIAYVAADPSPELADRIRASVLAALPDDTDVTVEVSRIDEIARGADGQPDTPLVLAALNSEGRTEYREPVGETELKLATLWCEVLGRSMIDRHDSFFNLGGNSVTAIRLLSRSSNAGFDAIPLHTFYEYDTIALMAEYLASQHKN